MSITQWGARMLADATRAAAVAEIVTVYRKNGGNMSHTADALGIGRRSLIRWRYGQTVRGKTTGRVPELADAMDRADGRKKEP